MPKLTVKDKKRRAKELAAETRRDKFERLAVRRVNRAITAIRLLGNLASSNYQWDLDDIKHIRTAFNREIEKTCAKFEVRRQPSGTEEFSFASRPGRRAPSVDAPTDWERWREDLQSSKNAPQAA